MTMTDAYIPNADERLVLEAVSVKPRPLGHRTKDGKVAANVVKRLRACGYVTVLGKIVRVTTAGIEALARARLSKS